MKFLPAILLVALALVLVLGLIPLSKKHTTHALAQQTEHKVYFAGGCFWGVEHMMAQVPGVINAVSGYANGHTQNPDYRSVVSGSTGHRETVEVTYNPELVSLKELVELYFSAIDPTVKNRQGNDIGSQYQTGIYYVGQADGTLIHELAEKERDKHPAFVVEIDALKNFWPAEDYHQDYLVKNPGGYCHLGPADFERARQTGKAKPVQKAEYRSINPQDAKKAMDAGTKLLLVDVREPYEFEAGHLKGAVNYPLESLLANPANFLPDKDALIYLYCRSGSRSQYVALQLVNLGYTNLYDLGGIIYWPYEVVR